MAPLLDAGAEVHATVRRLWETPDGKVVPIIFARVRRGDADSSVGKPVLRKRPEDRAFSGSPQGSRQGCGCIAAACFAFVSFLLLLAAIAASGTVFAEKGLR